MKVISTNLRIDSNESTQVEVRLKALTERKIVTLIISAFAIASFAVMPTFAVGPAGGSSNSSSTIGTQEECTWFLEGVPSTVTLEGPAGEVYEGDDFTVTATDPASLGTKAALYVSGNLGTGTFGANTKCTWYDDALIEGIAIDLTTPAGADTVTSSPDSSLDFAFDSSNPYTLDQNQEECVTAKVGGIWSTNDQTLYDGALNSSLFKILSTDVSKKHVASSANADRCQLTITYSLTIPGNMKPTLPGTDYSFTIPTVTWGVTVP